MSRFNLQDYETVAQRIGRFYTDHPDGRIHTDLLHALTDGQGWRFVVRACVYVGDELKASGLAEERLGGQGANKDAALENAETSAIGRALANWGYSGDKRASREEMSKSQRYESAKPAKPAMTEDERSAWVDTITAASTKDALAKMGAELSSMGAPDDLVQLARTRWAEAES